MTNIYNTIKIGHLVSPEKKRIKRKSTYVTGLPHIATILERHWKNSSPPRIVTRKCRVAFRFPFLFLPRLLDRVGIAGIEYILQSGKERQESGRELGPDSVGHYLLLTIFMRLSIAEISTRRDDIDWHAVKPSDMRLQRSPPTPTRPSCRVLSRPILHLYLHCKRSTLYLHIRATPAGSLKSHAPSISISPHPRWDSPSPCRIRKSALHQQLRRKWYRLINSKYMILD